MGSEMSRNSFRAAVLRGEKPPLVVTGKASRLEGAGDELECGMVKRGEARRSNHRKKDRHRLSAETAIVRHAGKSSSVELINLSSGGAMIRTDFAPRLWDVMELELGENYLIEGAVRWIKGDRIGLEFAHETRIECDPKERAELLLQVIQRSFGDQLVQLDRPSQQEPEAEVEEEDFGARTGKRHPLIWLGEIHYAHDSNPVRLRNVSAGGALLEVDSFYPIGAEVLLDLGGAGQFEGVVTWGVEDQIGIRFKHPFDIACLAKAKPEITPRRWEVPSFLHHKVSDADSPWHVKWGRRSIAEIRSELEGFLKR